MFIKTRGIGISPICTKHVRTGKLKLEKGSTLHAIAFYKELNGIFNEFPLGA